jgi:hypothetical protein
VVVSAPASGAAIAMFAAIPRLLLITMSDVDLSVDS